MPACFSFIWIELKPESFVIKLNCVKVTFYAIELDAWCIFCIHITKYILYKAAKLYDRNVTRLCYMSKMLGKKEFKCNEYFMNKNLSFNLSENLIMPKYLSFMM